jgi:biotin carboxylase
MPSAAHPMARCTILIATTTRWPIAARLAAALIDLGVRVAIICPRGNPAVALDDHVPCLHYTPLAPLQALSRAIVGSRCDLVVACDDRVVGHLQALHAAEPALQAVIERSIGPPSGYATTRSRVALIELAAACGLRVPETHTVPDRAALTAIAAAMPFPWIMKVDGTWGGAGVLRLANLAAARRGLFLLGRPISAARALRQLLWVGNPYPLLEMPGAGPPRISVQRYVEGAPANVLATAWQGDVVAAVCFDVLRTQRDFGASTVVRVIDQPEMLHAASTIARRLGLSGYFGLDFVIEHATGRPFLIELNPRTTQLGHLRLGPGRDLPGALAARLAGGSVPSVDCTEGKQLIALFPDAIDFGVEPALLADAFLDIPSSRPELVRRLSQRQRRYSIGGPLLRACGAAGASLARAKKAVTGA